jgi:uncharacterized protein YndB with AHSA1/START domain
MAAASATREQSQDGTTLELPGDREILITRSFDAPARLVFAALTTPEHVRRWWAPRSLGVELVKCEIDLRVGGRWHYVMSHHGEVIPSFYGEFIEIGAPTRLVMTEVYEPFPDGGAHVTVTLTEQGGRTTMTNLSVYPSKEVRDAVIESGMERGMRESMLQLTELVASLR